MREYIKYKIWDELEPIKPYARWVLEKMFRLHPNDIELICSPTVSNAIMTEWVYHLQGRLSLVDDKRADAKYLNPWNAARSDFIVELVPLPSRWTEHLKLHEEAIVDKVLQLQPRGDISLWLATYMFGFSHEEIKVLVPGTIITIQGMGNTLIPLLVSCFRRMQELRLTGETLSRYHKTRYYLLKYYLDATYHAINF